jgi:hypothetical protein
MKEKAIDRGAVSLFDQGAVSLFLGHRVRVMYEEWGPAPERWPTAKTTAKTATKTTARTTLQIPHSEIDRVIKAQSHRQDSDIYIPNKTHQN